MTENNHAAFVGNSLERDPKLEAFSKICMFHFTSLLDSLFILQSCREFSGLTISEMYKGYSIKSLPFLKNTARDVCISVQACT